MGTTAPIDFVSNVSVQWTPYTLHCVHLYTFSTVLQNGNNCGPLTLSLSLFAVSPLQPRWKDIWRRKQKKFCRRHSFRSKASLKVKWEGAAIKDEGFQCNLYLFSVYLVIHLFCAVTNLQSRKCIFTQISVYGAFDTLLIPLFKAILHTFADKNTLEFVRCQNHSANSTFVFFGTG